MGRSGVEPGVGGGGNDSVHSGGDDSDDEEKSNADDASDSSSRYSHLSNRSAVFGDVEHKADDSSESGSTESWVEPFNKFIWGTKKDTEVPSPITASSGTGLLAPARPVLTHNQGPFESNQDWGVDEEFPEFDDETSLNGSRHNSANSSVDGSDINAFVVEEEASRELPPGNIDTPPLSYGNLVLKKNVAGDVKRTLFPSDVVSSNGGVNTSGRSSASSVDIPLAFRTVMSKYIKTNFNGWTLRKNMNSTLSRFLPLLNESSIPAVRRTFGSAVVQPGSNRLPIQNSEASPVTESKNEDDSNTLFGNANQQSYSESEVGGNASRRNSEASSGAESKNEDDSLGLNALFESVNQQSDSESEVGGNASRRNSEASSGAVEPDSNSEVEDNPLDESFGSVSDFDGFIYPADKKQ